VSTAGLTQCTGSRELHTLDQDSARPCTAVRDKAIGLRLRTIAVKGLGSELPLPADTPAGQSSQVDFTCLAVDTLRRASAEVRTRQTSAADTACSEGTPAVILVAMEVGAAIPMAITTRAKGGLASDAIRRCHLRPVGPFKEDALMKVFPRMPPSERTAGQPERHQSMNGARRAPFWGGKNSPDSLKNQRAGKCSIQDFVWDGTTLGWAQALSVAEKTLPRADTKRLHQPSYQSTAAQPDEPAATTTAACLHRTNRSHRLLQIQVTAVIER
jgi:hypothetical protein